MTTFSIGAVLAGRYVVEAVIGEGAYGCVVRAYDQEQKRSVALKVLKSDRRLERDVFARFSMRELRLLARMQQTGGNIHVVRLLELELGWHDDAPFVVLEFINGPSLSERLKEWGHLPPSEAATFGAGIARGLAALHAAGGVHRDVKPSNIRLRDGRTAVLVDMGSTRALWETLAITQEHMPPMTPRYAAPEQLARVPASPATDVYALGLCLFEMLTGHVPLLGDGSSTILALRQCSLPPNPRALRPDIPPALARIVMHCLQPDPVHRPPAARVAAELTAQSSNAPVRRLPAFPAAMSLLLAFTSTGDTRFTELNLACSPLPGPFLAFQNAEDSTRWTFLSFHDNGLSRPPVTVNLRGIDIHFIGQLEHDNVIELIGWQNEDCRHERLRICADGTAILQKGVPCDMPRPRPSYRVRISMGDVDGNGRDDLAVYPLQSTTKNACLVGYTWLNAMATMPTCIDDAYELPKLELQNTYMTRRMGDMNGDGHIDLVVSTYDNGGICPTWVFLLSGDGQGHFTISTDVPFAAPPGRVAVLPMPANMGDLGDVDGDGLLDLVLGPDDDGDPGRLWLLRGTGQGFDEPEEVLDVIPAIEDGQDGGGNGAVVLDDWNNDGHLDAAVYHNPNRRMQPGVSMLVQIHLGDGTGAFSTSAWATVPVPASTPFVLRSR